MKKAEKKSKQEKEKTKKKKAGKTEQDDYQKPTAKHLAPSPRKSVADLLGSFEGKRRLLVSNLFGIFLCVLRWGHWRVHCVCEITSWTKDWG